MLELLKNNMENKKYQGKEANNSVLRTELISLYGRFIKNPNDEVILSELARYSGEYGGLITYTDILEKSPISKDVSDALAEISFSFQYKIGTFPQEELMEKAKRVLENLKKS